MKALIASTTIAILAASGACHAASAALIEKAKMALSSIQNSSFVSNREYCGMIGLTKANELIVSPARRGRTAGCDHRGFADRTITPVASYHTHGGFHAHHDSEVPSVSDIDMDYHNKVFGFVATPGGRMWMVDYRDRSVHQICGLGCLPQDPSFHEHMAGEIPTSMSRREVAQRKGVGGPRHLRARMLAENDSQQD
ncbi:MAG: DUF4329 domain-containing protein [Pseudomonadota bacterium]